jgi:zinc protease
MIMLVKRFSLLFTLASFFLLCFGVSYQTAMAVDVSAEPPIIVVWPHEKSDLAPDPSIEYGRLQNGLRYVLMENHEPKNRVSMHLNVLAGSLNESAEEQGLAHFLEHMLFNGSENFKPGELVEYFQSIGMHFGADANAHTGFNETVYDILLPNGDREDLQKGLLVLSDYAKGALLLETEIERERKVIMAEKLSRDSASYRTFKSTLKFELADTLIPHRLPIGTEEVIKNADRNLMKGFYDAWYRPENMVLVITGDFNTQEIKPLITDRFSKFYARAPARPLPKIDAIRHKGLKPFYHYEKEAGNTDISIEVVRKVFNECDSYEYARKRILEDLGNRIIQNRLNEKLEKADTPFTSVSISSGTFLREIEYAEISAECHPENWKKTLHAIEQELRKAIQFDFTSQELERVKKDYLAELDKAVKGASTRKSQKLARQIIWHLNNDRVLMSPEQEQDSFSPVISSVTSKEVHDIFKKIWAPSFRLFLVTGNAMIETEPENHILAEIEKSSMTPVFKPETVTKKEFPYLPRPAIKGEIISRKEFFDLGITCIDFKNGIRLNLKQTDFKANQVLLSCIYGNGRSGEPDENPGLGPLSSSVVNESGTETIKKNELEIALAGKNTSVYFDVEDEYFSFSGNSVTNEVQLLFELLYAFILDTGFREDAFNLSMERFEQKYKTISHKIEGAMALKGNRFLAGGDLRFGLPPFEKFRQNTLHHIKNWINQSKNKGGFEISVVGDFDPETVIEMAAIYPASIYPVDIGKNDIQKRNPVFPENQSIEIPVSTKIKKGTVVVAYSTEDFWDIKRTRRFIVLSQIFSERLRKRIREKLGATYSPYAYNDPSKAYSDYGVFKAVVTVEPGNAEKVVSEIKSIALEIAKNGITDTELSLALKPVLTMLKDMRRSNRYWLKSVLEGLKKHPEQIEWSRNIMADYESITKNEIEKLAAKYLDNKKAAIIIIKPDMIKSEK